MRKTILIVEDHRMINGYYRLLLDDYPDIEVLFTDTGKNALSLINTQARPVDLVLLSYSLLDMDGVVIAKHLRHQGVKAPICMISTNRLSAQMQSHLHPLIQRFYQHPLRSDQWQAIVAHYLYP